MPEIGKKDIIPDELNIIIKDNFSNPIAILERWYCNDNEKPDFFNYLSNLNEKVSVWDKGRVFDNISEIRWGREKDIFHLVWIKDQGNIPDEWSPEQIKLLTLNRKILLWGIQITGKNEWYEKQVPRIFDYPSKGSSTHVYAILNEYCIGDESKVYRFKDVISK